MDTSELIRQVKSRPAIWSEARKDNKKLAAAWHRVCKLAWPEFDTWTVEQKRIKGLELQKKWDKLQQSFIREYLRQKQGTARNSSPLQRCPFYHQLSFLSVTIDNKSATPSSNKSPAASSKPETTTVNTTPVPAPPPVTTTSATPDPGPSATTASTSATPGRDAEEDRQFLLSLVSFMQDVPRSRKLALRSELIQVIAKYSDGDSHTGGGDSYPRHNYVPMESQEY